MAKEIRYTYNGKEVGTLRKLVSDVVVLEESWLSAADKFFAESGYQHFLKYGFGRLGRPASEVVHKHVYKLGFGMGGSRRWCKTIFSCFKKIGIDDMMMVSMTMMTR